MPEKISVVETFSAFSKFGRFAIRDRNQTIGGGVIIEVTKRAKKSFIASSNIKCKGDVQTIEGNRWYGKIILKCDEYILDN